MMHHSALYSYDYSFFFFKKTARGIVVIPKSTNRERIIENFQCTDFDLSAEDMAALDSLDCNFRMVSLPFSKNHPHYPFGIEF